MSEFERKICLTTLAIGSKYRRHSLQLAQDIQSLSKNTPFVILTDNPEIFSGKEYIIPVRHNIQSVGVYHDKLDCIVECFQRGFDCCIFLDADCRLLLNIVKSRCWKTGITAKSCSDLKRYIIKNSHSKKSKLINDLAEKYEIKIEQCKFVYEWIFVVCKDSRNNNLDKFLQSWREIRDYLEINGIYNGEGAAIGMAACIAGWPVHHYDTGYPEESERHRIIDSYKDKMFLKKKSIPERLRETIKVMDEKRKAIEKQPQTLSAITNKFKNSFSRKLRYIRLIARTVLSRLKSTVTL